MNMQNRVTQNKLERKPNFSLNMDFPSKAERKLREIEEVRYEAINASGNRNQLKK
jgi:hypothetical protein